MGIPAGRAYWTPGGASLAGMTAISIGRELLQVHTIASLLLHLRVELAFTCVGHLGVRVVTVTDLDAPSPSSITECIMLLQLVASPAAACC